MNERIKELMNEVIGFRLDPDSKHYEAQVSPEDLEMFAELIVRECAQLVKSTQLTEDGHTWRSADYVVLEHFGVEE